VGRTADWGDQERVAALGGDVDSVPGVVLSGPSSEALWIALVAPYTNAAEDVISLGWPPGGVILRGANLVCDDASLFVRVPRVV
jgi:hypothetical protein